MSTDLMMAAAQEARQRIAARLRTATPGPLSVLYDHCRAHLEAELEPDTFADMLAQTITCAAAAVGSREALAGFIGELAQNEPILASALRGGSSGEAGTEGTGTEGTEALLGHRALAGLLRLRVDDRTGSPSYERFLAEYGREQRRARGVYYTPDAVITHIVESLHAALKEELGLPLGLADTTRWGELVARQVVPRPPGISDDDWTRLARLPYVRVFDPAVGTGAFLGAVIEVCHRTMIDHWQVRSATGRRRRWDEYAHRDLLPRLYGCEIMMAPCTLARLHLTRALRRRGYEGAGGLNLWWADALTPDTARRAARATVVLGNPPYCGFSRNSGPWIDGLLRGRLPSGERVASFYEVDGRPLGERKTWLCDDYVKFIRLAQHLIEESGSGLIGFVTNHGYLDNPTFRGMRQQLLSTFSGMSFFDLHGNAKRPVAGRDDNVFDIQQGVAIGLFRKGGRERREYRSLRGQRERKLERLGRATMEPATVLEPRPPFYFFVPRAAGLAEYEAAWSITDIMPRHCTAVITARDALAVDLSSAALLARVADLRADDQEDDAIRARYFAGRRSTGRYPPGDTRGWKLPVARQSLRADPEWRERPRRYHYRPMDERWIYYAPWLIDWPRPEIMSHMLGRPNIGLCTCRQLSSGPWRHLLPTRGLTDDCYVSNRTRERAYLFPLYLDPDGAPNLAPGFVDRLTTALDLRFVDRGAGDGQSTVGPEDLLAYFYALMSASAYRQRYLEPLRSDFPRLPLPATRELLRGLCAAGRRLLALHLLEGEIPLPAGLTFEDGGDRRVTRVGEPHQGLLPLGAGRGRLYINRRSYFENIPLDAWDLEIGAYRVCPKWLADRRRAERQLDDDDVSHYLRLVAGLHAAVHVVKEIDACVQAGGGMPAIFASA